MQAVPAMWGVVQHDYGCSINTALVKVYLLLVIYDIDSLQVVTAIAIIKIAA